MPKQIACVMNPSGDAATISCCTENTRSWKRYVSPPSSAQRSGMDEGRKSISFQDGAPIPSNAGLSIGEPPQELNLCLGLKAVYPPGGKFAASE